MLLALIEVFDCGVVDLVRSVFLEPVGLVLVTVAAGLLLLLPAGEGAEGEGGEGVVAGGVSVVMGPATAAAVFTPGGVEGGVEGVVVVVVVVKGASWKAPLTFFKFFKLHFDLFLARGLVGTASTGVQNFWSVTVSNCCCTATPTG